MGRGGQPCCPARRFLVAVLLGGNSRTELFIHDGAVPSGSFAFDSEPILPSAATVCKLEFDDESALVIVAGKQAAHLAEPATFLCGSCEAAARFCDIAQEAEQVKEVRFSRGIRVDNKQTIANYEISALKFRQLLAVTLVTRTPAPLVACCCHSVTTLLICLRLGVTLGRRSPVHRLPKQIRLGLAFVSGVLLVSLDPRFRRISPQPGWPAGNRTRCSPVSDSQPPI